jgi:hypothetical protein
MAKPRAASPADPSTPAEETAVLVAAEPDAEPTTPITAAKTAKLPAAAAKAPATAKVPAAKAPATAKVAKAPATAKVTTATAPATAKLPAAEAPATAKLQAADAPAATEPETAPPAVAGAVGPRISAAALRFAAVAYVATVLTPLFGYLSIPFPANSFVITASAYAYYIPFGILLIALIVAAVASDRPLPIKVVAILLVVIGASLIAMSLVVFVPWLALLAPIPLFFSWALTAGFRGWGYLGLVFALVTIAIQWLAGSVISWGALFAVPAIVVAVIAAAAIAGTAALERVSARRQESAA